MSISEDFYLKFPSLNVNSKENIRNRRITQDCVNFLTQKEKSPSPKKNSRNNYKQRRSQISDNVITRQPPQSPLEVIFSVEERNQHDNQLKLEQQKIYQRVLEKQIKEQQMKKQKEKLKRQEEERIFEERYKRQVQQQIEELQSQKKAEKVIERISLSENEKEKYNQDRHMTSRSEPPNNHVYRYFSRSARKDQELFNYKKLFEDIINDYREQDLYEPKPLKKSSSEGKLCRHTNAECTRCHKKLDMFCQDCNFVDLDSRDRWKKPATTTNRMQIEHSNGEHELPISKDQQVVIYRADDQHMPFSFNVDKDSKFYGETLEDLRKYSDRKLANYVKNYGSLRRKKKDTGTITDESIPNKEKLSDLKILKPQEKLEMLELKSEKIKSTDNAVSQLDEIFDRAQITTITQIGLARKHLAKEALDDEDEANKVTN